MVNKDETENFLDYFNYFSFVCLFECFMKTTLPIIKFVYLFIFVQIH